MQNFIPFLVGGWTAHLKNMSQNGFIFPKVRGENKKSLSCHHLDFRFWGIPYHLGKGIAIPHPTPIPPPQKTAEKKHLAFSAH